MADAIHVTIMEMSEAEMTDSTVLVTGASGGIGRLLTERLRERGFTVIGWDMNPDPECDPLPVDVADWESVQRAADGLPDRLDAVVTIVDAKHGMETLDVQEEAQKQVGFADRILITKTDVVQPDEVAQLRQRLVKMNPRAKIGEAKHGVAAIDDLLDIRGFNLNAILEIEPDFLTDVDHEHDDEVTSFVFRESRPLSLERVEDFLSGIVQVYGTKLMRYKGVLSIRNVEQRVVFQGVHMLMGSDIGAAWKPGEMRDSKMVFIGRDIPKDVLLDGLAQCVAGAGKPLLAMGR